MVNKLKITRDINYQQLHKFYKNSTDYRIRERALMLIHVFEGKSGKETADILKIDRQTVSTWVHRFNEGGLNALQDKARSGRPSKVDYDDLKDALNQHPSNFGYPHELWFPILIINYLLQYQGVKIAFDYVYTLIDRIGYSSVVPRERSYKSDPKKVEDYKNDIHQRIEKGDIGENDLVAVDESAFQLYTRIKKVVVPKGTKPVMKINKSYQAVTIIGALTGWGEFVYELQDHKATKFEFCDFLENLKKRTVGQSVHLILDRANYHYNKVVFQKAIDSGIELLFQPTHSPFLNAVEEVWRQLKDYLRSMIFYSRIELHQAIQKFFDDRPTFNIHVIRYVS